MDKKILKNADIIVLRDKGPHKYLCLNALRNMLGLLRCCLGRDFKYNYAPTQCSILYGDASIHEYFDQSQNMKGMKDSRDPLVFPAKLKYLLNDLDDLHKELKNTTTIERQLISLIEALINPVEYLLIECPAQYLEKRQIDNLKDYLLKYKTDYSSIIILSHHSEYWHSITDYFVDYDKDKSVYHIYDNHLKKEKSNQKNKLALVNKDHKKAA